MFFICSYYLMECFDPTLAGQTSALPAPGWTSCETGKLGGIFGERAIGELVHAIVTRLAHDTPWSSDQD